MILRRIYYTSVFCFITTASLLAQDQTMHFLDARAKALSGAASTLTHSAYSFLWNPANLAFHRRPIFSINENQLFKYDQTALADLFPVIGPLALSIGQLSDNYLTEFISFGMARTLSQGLYLGITNNIFKREKQISWDANVGLSFYPGKYFRNAKNPILQHTNFAAVFQHASITKNRFGPMSQFNLGMHYTVHPDLIDIYLEGQFHKSRDRFVTAAELKLTKYITWRSGITDLEKNNLFWGAGLHFNSIDLDVVYNKYMEQFQFSFSIKFGKSPVLRAEQYYQKGIGFLEKEDIKPALTQFKNATLYYPENEEYQRVYQNIQNYYKSLKEKENQLISIAQGFEQEGKYFPALVKYLDILDQFPGNEYAKTRIVFLKPIARNQMQEARSQAIDLFEKGELLIAKKVFDKIHHIYPDDAIIQEYRQKITQQISGNAEEHFYRGLGYYSQKNFEAAQKEFDQTYRLNPNYDDIETYLMAVNEQLDQKNKKIQNLIAQAKEYENSGDYSRSIEFYSEVLKIDDTNEEAKNALGILKPKVEKYVQNLYARAQNAYQNQNFEQAESLCRNLIRIRPDDIKCKQLLANIKKTRRELAQNYWQKGKSAYNQNQDGIAVQNFQKAIELDGRDDQYAKDMKLAQQRIARKQKWQEANQSFEERDFVLAEKLILELLEMEPNNQQYSSFLTKIRSDRNRYVTFLLQTGIYQYSQEKYKEAIQTFDQILVIDPKNQIAGEYKDRIQEKIKALEKLK